MLDSVPESGRFNGDSVWIELELVECKETLHRKSLNLNNIYHTVHILFNKPYLWSTENHSDGKRNGYSDINRRSP